MCNLVFVHGRAQEGKNPDALKEAWVSYWAEGLKKSGRTVPLENHKIHFPFYGDTLADLTDGLSPEDAAKIVVRGLQSTAPGGVTDDEKGFIEAVMFETLERDLGNLADLEIAKEAPELQVVEKGPLNLPWVQALMEVFDRHIPGASAASVALVTRDVYRYLTNTAVRRVIDNGFAAAMPKGERTVVVSHSLGTVVAFNALRGHPDRGHWQVPSFMTLGSPLAVKVVREKLHDFAPLGFPRPPVQAWFNAMDTRDYVSLFPLDEKHFPITGAGTIRNKMDVRNSTANRHGIAGYLKDAEVAKWIYDAVTEG